MLIVVHSGAGDYDAALSEYRATCQTACRALDSHHTAGSESIVCESLALLESDALTNCGRGSHYNQNGNVECDASLMNQRGAFAAVGALSHCLNPIRVAHRLLCELEGECLPFGLERPILLVGQGAQDYAAKHQIGRCPMADLSTKRSSAHYKIIRQKLLEHKTDSTIGRRMQDTVGAICIDAKDSMSVGCSSGGLAYKYPGRIGQAAILGAGLYCYHWTIGHGAFKGTGASVACTTSGLGEYIIKHQIAIAICMLVKAYMEHEDEGETSLEDRLAAYMRTKTDTRDRLQEAFGAVLVFGSRERGYELWALFNTKQFHIAWKTEASCQVKVTMRRVAEGQHHHPCEC